MTPLTIVVGAGPAGCAAARLLAAWGHRVLVFERPAGERRALAESIPPSTAKVLEALGMLRAIDDARFQPWQGNTVWWGTDEPRVETFPAGAAGFQVDRAAFDRVLRDLASAAGAEIRSGLVREVVDGTVVVDDGNGRVERVPAAVVLDCSGRAGVIARAGARRWETSHRTVALAGIWSAQDWPGTDDRHTLVASHDAGWAWSVCTGIGVRYFTVMVDPARSGLARGVPSRDVYLDALARITAFQPALRAATLVDGPWGADASLYDAERYSAPGVLLVGDAGSFIDPLSSFGVKKALASGWLAAIATHTALTRPAMRDDAFAFFNRRERDVYAAARRQAASFAADADVGSARPFWLARVTAAPDDPRSWADIDVTALGRDVDVQTAFADLKRRVTISLRANPDTPLAARPVVRGREIVLADHLILDGMADGIRYLRDLDLVAIRDLAPAYRDVGDLCDAVARAHPGASLPDILGALSVLIARRALVHATG